MPAQHYIDSSIKLITTNWSGVATDNELIDALLKYRQEIRSCPEYRSYNEIVDFSGASDFNLSANGLARLSQIAASSDIQGVKTRLAIVVNIPLAYGLSRMYEIYRSLTPSGNKDVRVFKNHASAFEWIVSNLQVEENEEHPNGY